MSLNHSSTPSQPVSTYAGSHSLNRDTQPHGSTIEKAVIFPGQSAELIFFAAQPSTQPVENAVMGRGE